MPNTSEQAFIEQIEKHAGIIHKVIQLYVDSAEDRRDVYQEILLQAWKSFQKFRGDSSFSTWLYKVCLNTVLTFSRKLKKYDELPNNYTNTPSNHQDKQETSDVLYYLIRQLNETDRMIMTLYLEGYKNKEIAEITGLTVNHINVKIHRLKTQIVNDLKKEKYGLT
ncbi:MAG: sigma-70 family RNA polymerase sigma factor [Bacteroidetes bacterium]|jgi:RNA polymerase sigma-70 factor (ECF subfamily)|nr:sigma-70 family RNA polymerase sigma factor [Bacteroidota bacterium]MDF1864306.1 sigma-70 family RNA polymerase sigma factor [Saprospiraceae bacterium]